VKTYSKKALQIWVSAQAVEGVPTATAAVLATDAIACTDPTYDINISNDTVEFAGDEFSRDVRTDITDRVLETAMSTLMPCLGIPVGVPSVTDFPQEALYESTGATITYSGTDVTAEVKISNDIVNSNKTTIMVSAVSADDLTVQKVYRGFDANTSVDLTPTHWSLSKLR